MVSLTKGTPLVIDWLYIIGMGLLIAVLEMVYPAGQRRQNRENVKNAFIKIYEYNNIVLKYAQMHKKPTSCNHSKYIWKVRQMKRVENDTMYDSLMNR